jgi:hypothetical protein
MKGGSTIVLALIALLAAVVLGLIALQGHGGGLGDWRQAGIREAEQRMRAELGDPGAKFSEEQLTGDQRSGQTCGRVITSAGASERFIVYIDTPEPYIEGGLGRKALSQEQFDGDWESDCLHEGYNVAPAGTR